MTTLRFDPARSKITIETKAVGLFGKLAHDLSIVGRELSATVDTEGDGAAVEVTAPVASLAVDGVRKGEIVDRTVLSASDRADIEKKMRGEVLTSQAVIGKATIGAWSKPLSEAGTQTVEVEIVFAIGGKTQRVHSRVEVLCAAEGITAKGRAALDLHALGIKPPKGPLGAFRVHEIVHVDFDLVFTTG